MFPLKMVGFIARSDDTVLLASVVRAVVGTLLSGVICARLLATCSKPIGGVRVDFSAACGTCFLACAVAAVFGLVFEILIPGREGLIVGGVAQLVVFFLSASFLVNHSHDVPTVRAATIASLMLLIPAGIVLATFALFSVIM